MIERASAALAVLLALTPPSLEGSPGDAPAARAGAAVPGALMPRTDTALLVLQAPGPPMLLVPRSSFTMGSTGDEMLAAFVSCQKEPRGHVCSARNFSDEGPERVITLSAYYLDRLEVTVKDYARCAAASRCRPLPLGEGARRFARPDYPASLVTWEEAREYCAFRGARLPTEAEFERAARGVTGRRYPWGEVYNSHASNHGRFDWKTIDEADGYAELAPVGSFPAGRTPEGFMDLAGNVSEWVQDRYAPSYDPAEVTDPLGQNPPNSSPARVIRGGGFDAPSYALRGASRSWSEPGGRRPTIGFRCARSAEARSP